MDRFAIISLSICIGIDLLNYSHQYDTGEWILDMGHWYNSPAITILNIFLVASLLLLGIKKS